MRLVRQIDMLACRARLVAPLKQAGMPVTTIINNIIDSIKASHVALFPGTRRVMPPYLRCRVVE